MRGKENIKHTDEWKQMKKSWEYFISSRSLPTYICFTLIMFTCKTTGIIEHQSSYIVIDDCTRSFLIANLLSKHSKMCLQQTALILEDIGHFLDILP